MTGLGLRDLTVTDPRGRVLVDRVSVTVRRGQVVALLSEPGSGAMEVVGALLESRGGHTVRGEIVLGEDELLVLDAAQRRRVRGARIGAIFADPRAAFDPGLTLADSLLEVIVHGAGVDLRTARERLRAALSATDVPDPDATVYRRVAELPAGILQRACVALAEAAGVEVLVAEHPGRALDPIDAADVHELLRSLADRCDVAVLLVTDDLGQAARIADEIVVLYAGEVHEAGPTRALLERPRGPYTRALLASVPRLDARDRRRRALAGVVPSGPAGMRGCRLAPRCPFVEPLCERHTPDLRTVDERTVRCHFADEDGWRDRLAAYHGATP